MIPYVRWDEAPEGEVHHPRLDGEQSDEAESGQMVQREKDQPSSGQRISK